MSTRQHLPLFFVKIGVANTPDDRLAHVPTEFMDLIDEIVVDTSLNQPDMVTIRLHDPTRRWVNDKQLLGFGKKLVVDALPEGAPVTASKKLVEVEITGMEPEFQAAAVTTMLIRGYHRSNRLHLGRHSRVYIGRRDSDIVREIAQELGLEADVDVTDVQYEYVLQNNQTYWEFLSARAARIGYQIYGLNNQLFFKKTDAQLNTTPIPLTLGDTLRHFRPRMSIMHQADRVRVYGWDAKGKRTLMADATPDATFRMGGMEAVGAVQAQAAFQKPAQELIVDSPVSSVEEATALARGLAADIDRDFLEADGLCEGNPAIRAGCKIKLDGLGQRFDGEYFVTTARHLYRPDGYTVEFTVSGRQPKTLPQLLAPANGKAKAGRRVDSVVIGLVTNLNDPEQLGRVKVKYPWLFDDHNLEIESTWARLVAPMAGQDGKGFYALPEIDDEVLIAFEQGDVNRPYIVGVLWNHKDRPPIDQEGAAVKGSKVVKRIIRSRLGHEIVFDDSDDSPSVVISTSNGHKITLSDTGDTPKIELLTNGKHQIVLNDESGKESILVSDNSGNTVLLDSAKKLLSLKSTLIQLQSATDILLEAGGRLVLSGATGLALSAPNGGVFDSRGPLTIKSSSALNLESDVVVSIQGTQVKIN